MYSSFVSSNNIKLIITPAIDLFFAKRKIANVNGSAKKSGWKRKRDIIPLKEKTPRLKNSIEMITEYNLDILLSIQMMKIIIEHAK